MAGPGRLLAVRDRRPDGAPAVPSRAPRPEPRPLDGGLGLGLRLPAFVVVSTVLGAGAHALLDPHVPAERLFAVAVVGVVLCVLPFRRRELSFPALAALVVAGQTVVHAVLSLCHCSPTSLVGGFVHRVLCPETLSAQQAAWTADPLLLTPPPASGYLAHLVPGAAMVVGHLLAAVVAAWWLRRGEAAVWRAVRTVWPRLVTALPRPVAVPVPALRSRPATAPVLLRSLVDAVAVRPHRGPPLPA